MEFNPWPAKAPRVNVTPPQPQPVQEQEPSTPAWQLPPEEMISPEQHVAGVAKHYRNFCRADVAYRLVRDTLAGKRRFPILSATCAGPNGEPALTLEFDVHAPFQHLQDDAQRRKGLQQMLGPLHNYYVQTYRDELRELSLYSLNAYRLLSGNSDELPRYKGDYDGILQRLHEAYHTFEPKWLQLKEVEDGVAKGELVATLGGSTLDLSQMLAHVGVPAEHQHSVLAKIMSEKIQELQRELVPCLQTLAATAAMAVQIVDQSLATR